MDLALNSLPFLWDGLVTTLQVSFLVVFLSLGTGVVLGVGVTYGTAVV